MSRDHLGSRYSWADLPPEIVNSIAGRLKRNTNDVRSLRAVCKPWRSSIPPPAFTLCRGLPLFIPAMKRRPPHCHFTPLYQDIMLICTAVFLLRPPQQPSAPGWLVAVEQSSPEKLRLFHPLTRLPITPLPENFPQYLPADVPTQCVSIGYNLRMMDSGRPLLERNAKEFCANKIVLWPNPKSPCIDNCSIMVLHKRGSLICLPLTQRYTCKLVGFGQAKYDDVVIRNGLATAVDRAGKLYVFEYQWNVVTKILDFVQFPNVCNQRRKRLLLDSNTNELYLIVRDHRPKKLAKFKVYKLNERMIGWEEVNTLGDRVLFVSFDTCFFVPARDLPGFLRNCIVFPKDCFPVYSGTNFPDNILFKAANNSEVFDIGIYEYGNDDNFKLISDCAGFSDALWPPPQWICAGSSTSHQ